MKPPPKKNAPSSEQESYFHPINQALREAGFQSYSRDTGLGFGADLPPTFSNPEEAAVFEAWYAQQKKTAQIKAQLEAEEAQSQAELDAIATAPKPPSPNLMPPATQPLPWRSNASGRPVAPVRSAWGGPSGNIMLSVMETQQRRKDPRQSSALLGTSPFESSPMMQAFKGRR